MKESLNDKTEELYEQTKCRVRVNDKLSEEFEVRRGLRQGCPLSAVLIICFISDVDKMFRKAQMPPICAFGIEREKVWSLAYADDLVILAKEKGELKGMIGNLEKYVRKKKLEVNVEKTKVMVFRKGVGRRKKY